MGTAMIRKGCDHLVRLAWRAATVGARGVINNNHIQDTRKTVNEPMHKQRAGTDHDFFRSITGTC